MAHSVRAWSTAVGSAMANSTNSPRMAGARSAGRGRSPTVAPAGRMNLTVVSPWSRPPSVSGEPDATTRPDAITKTVSASVWASSM
jgi:hypothetical protein